MNKNSLPFIGFTRETLERFNKQGFRYGLHQALDIYLDSTLIPNEIALKYLPFVPNQDFKARLIQLGHVIMLTSVDRHLVWALCELSKEQAAALYDELTESSHSFEPTLREMYKQPELSFGFLQELITRKIPYMEFLRRFANAVSLDEDILTRHGVSAHRSLRYYYLLDDATVVIYDLHTDTIKGYLGASVGLRANLWNSYMRGMRELPVVKSIYKKRKRFTATDGRTLALSIFPDVVFYEEFGFEDLLNEIGKSIDVICDQLKYHRSIVVTLPHIEFVFFVRMSSDTRVYFDCTLKAYRILEDPFQVHQHDAS